MAIQVSTTYLSDMNTIKMYQTFQLDCNPSQVKSIPGLVASLLLHCSFFFIFFIFIFIFLVNYNWPSLDWSLTASAWVELSLFLFGLNNITAIFLYIHSCSNFTLPYTAGIRSVISGLRYCFILCLCLNFKTWAFRCSTPYGTWRSPPPLFVYKFRQGQLNTH